MKYLNTKPGSIEEVAANMSKYAAESEYQDMFKKELEKAGKGIGAMTPKEKKAFFNKIDSKYTAKDEAVNEGITEPNGRISQKNKDLLKVNNYITVKGKVYVIDKVSLKDGVYTMKAFDENGKMHTISSKDVDSVEHWKASLKVASYDPKNEQVDNPYAVGMAQAMKAKDDQPPLKKSTITKAHDIAKSIEKDQKEEVEIKEEDAYQNDRFAVSGNTAKIDNSNTPDKSNHVHAPNAKTAVAMYKAGVKSYKDTDDMRKKFPMAVEEVQETHSFTANKQNEKQKKVGGEKDIVDPAPSIKKESLYDSIKSVWQISAEEMDKIKSEAKYYKKEQNKNDLKSKKIADTGSKSTPVDVEPKVEL
jgi:hypothetical protein